MILGGNASIQSRGYDLFRELVAARAHEGDHKGIWGRRGRECYIACRRKQEGIPRVIEQLL
jgi:hypothetical protein